MCCNSTGCGSTTYGCAHDGVGYVATEVVKDTPLAFVFGLKQRRLPGDMVVVRANDGAIMEVYIEKVIYKNPATVVFWSDGTKTVSKCSGGDTYNPEAGLAICIMKKLNGNTATRECLQAWCPHSVTEQESTVRTLRDVRKDSKKTNKVENT